MEWWQWEMGHKILIFCSRSRRYPSFLGVFTWNFSLKQSIEETFYNRLNIFLLIEGGKFNIKHYFSSLVPIRLLRGIDQHERASFYGLEAFSTPFREWSYLFISLGKTLHDFHKYEETSLKKHIAGTWCADNICSSSSYLQKDFMTWN